MTLVELGLAIAALNGGQLADEHLNQKVARATGGLQEPRVDALGLALD